MSLRCRNDWVRVVRIIAAWWVVMSSPPGKLMKSKIVLTAVLFIVLTGFLLAVKQLSPQPLSDELLETVNAECDVSGVCQVELSDRSVVTFDVEPEVIRPLLPLAIAVETSSADVRMASVRFTGKQMDMGLQPVELVQNAAGDFTGEGMITFCTMNPGMVWVAEVMLQSPEGIRRIAFELGSADLTSHG